MARRPAPTLLGGGGPAPLRAPGCHGRLPAQHRAERPERGGAGRRLQTERLHAGYGEAELMVQGGNNRRPATPTVTAGSIQTGDSPPTWIESYDTKDVGTGKTLTPAGTVSDGCFVRRSRFRLVA